MSRIIPAASLFRIAIGALVLVAAAPVLAQSLTFEERVAAQAAIERVAYSHRVGTTQPFEEAVPRAVIEEKVRRMLRLATEVEAATPITPAMLRLEIRRIETSTRFPERLLELYSALGNDPLKIAECVARPALVGQLASSGSVRVADPASGASSIPFDACPPESWAPLTSSGAPSGRLGVTTVWTGSEMIVWGGSDGSSYLATGGAYDPVLDAWHPVTDAGAPVARTGHSAVWTGSRMIVWGGSTGSGSTWTNTGGAYDPVADQWTPTNVDGAPSPRRSHSSAWTGTRMIVWGGTTLSVKPNCNGDRSDGALYDPAIDSWTPMATAGAPSPRHGSSAVWTGREMIVWGGSFEYYCGLPPYCCWYYGGGGKRYDPSTDVWAPITTLGAPPDSSGHSTVWTGSRMFAWQNRADSSGRYDPGTDSWADVSPVGAPYMVSGSAIVWSGSDVILWGGQDSSGYLNLGWKYDPVSDSWNPITNTGAPSGRLADSAVWAEDEMLIWGGTNDTGLLVDGGRYYPGDSDSDGDGLCDSVDPCPADPLNDADRDGRCANVDNCPNTYNRAQRDTDGDGIGDLCDNCPSLSNSTQADADGDGAGDACDCQPGDANDRRPAEPRALTVDKLGTTTTLSCEQQSQADAYAFSRGLLSAKGPSEYGSCLVQGLASCHFEDSEVPAAGEGFFYLAQAQNYDCGMGSLGATSAETERSNIDSVACTGVPVVDARPESETTIFGTVTGDYQATISSDNAYEAITEVLSTGGSPPKRYSQLEHRWAFTVQSGANKALHVEGFRTAYPQEDFRFEYSTDGGATFTGIELASLPYSDNDTDIYQTLPSSVTGSVIVRVVDTDQTPGQQSLETVSIDEIWIRIVP